MAKRLSAKHRIRSRDKARAYAEGTAPKGHKIALLRSAKAKKKNILRAY